MLHDLSYFLRREGDSAPHKIIDHSCFHNHWPASKTKLNENLFESKGAPGVSGALRSLRILRIGRTGSAHIYIYIYIYSLLIC